jgi:hypothetical protein
MNIGQCSLTTIVGLSEFIALMRSVFQDVWTTRNGVARPTNALAPGRIELPGERA